MEVAEAKLEFLTLFNHLQHACHNHAEEPGMTEDDLLARFERRTRAVLEKSEYATAAQNRARGLLLPSLTPLMGAGRRLTVQLVLPQDMKEQPCLNKLQW